MLKNVLIVEDSYFMRVLIKNTLEEGGHRVIAQAENGEQAIDLAFDLLPDIITLDNILPDMIGIDILRVYKKRRLPSKVIIISALGQKSIIVESIRLGAKAYLVKPFTSDQLLELMDRL